MGSQRVQPLSAVVFLLCVAVLVLVSSADARSVPKENVVTTSESELLKEAEHNLEQDTMVETFKERSEDIVEDTDELNEEEDLTECVALSDETVDETEDRCFFLAHRMLGDYSPKPNRQYHPGGN